MAGRAVGKGVKEMSCQNGKLAVTGKVEKEEWWERIAGLWYMTPV